MKWNFFTVTERSCNYPKPLELPLGALQEAAKNSVLSTSLAPSAVPTGVPETKFAINLIGSILGSHLHSSNMVNVGGCGRYGCDCGYDEEKGMIGEVRHVISDMMASKDYANIVLIVHTMEAEKVRKENCFIRHKRVRPRFVIGAKLTPEFSLLTECEG
jgi:hypothetical protein